VSGFIEGALWSAPREKRIRADDISGTATPAVLPPTSSTRIENGENGRGESNGHANGSNGAAVDESKALIDRVDSVGRVGETVGGWRRAVLQGMLLAPLVGNVTGLVGVMPDQGLGVWEKMSPGRLAVAGLLVGLGSRVSNGVSSWLGCLIHSLTLRSSGLVAPGTLQTLPPHLMLSSRLKPPRSLRSGHMLCGLSRIHPRSVAATFTFFPIAVLTANLVPASPPLPAPFPDNFDGSSLSSWTSLLPPLSHVPGLVLPIGIYSVLQLALGSYVRSRSLQSNRDVPSFIKGLPYLLSGLVFGLGLQLSGMANPAKVLGFLTFPNWSTFDPSLSLVLVFAVLPNALHWYTLNQRFAAREQAPAPAYPWEKWSIPTRKDIDWRLIVGAAIFGVGWGLAGGTKAVGAIRGVLTFGAAMVGGMQLARTI
jgi:uncharacterized membrane protein YedE/YeeE